MKLNCLIACLQRLNISYNSHGFDGSYNAFLYLQPWNCLYKLKRKLN